MTKINELNYGGKILLPNSSLDSLVRKNIQWPMLFKLTNPDPVNQRVTHAGVLEFLAEEGKCYLPSWMMTQLGMTEGAILTIDYVSLPKAVYAKFKPMSTDFLHVSNPRAMLEVELRKFACLTKNDVIAVQYNEQVFEFKVMDLKPVNAVTIIECDINIEFDAPEGYVEPEPQYTKDGHSRKMPEPPAPKEQKTAAWEPFTGRGIRLDGKSDVSGSQPTDTKKGELSNAPVSSEVVPDVGYEPGMLNFVRYNYTNLADQNRIFKEEQESKDSKNPFSGKGHTIRKRN